MYFKAFESKLIIICVSRFLSVIIEADWSGSPLFSNWTLSSKFFSWAFNLNTFRHSCSRSSTLHWVMFSTKDFASICAKSRMSLIRKSMRFAQFVAISRNCWPRSSTLVLRIFRDEIMPLSGFLNSWAAYAKAIVLMADVALCLSNSIKLDISLTFVIMNWKPF